MNPKTPFLWNPTKKKLDHPQIFVHPLKKIYIFEQITIRIGREIRDFFFVFNNMFLVTVQYEVFILNI